jgi:predicted RNase H-like HicB family nuclease
VRRFRHLMKRDFNIIIKRDAAGCFVASVPELRGCHTQAKSLDTLMRRVREVIELCLEIEGEVTAAGEFVAFQRITVERANTTPLDPV